MSKRSCKKLGFPKGSSGVLLLQSVIPPLSWQASQGRRTALGGVECTPPLLLIHCLTSFSFHLHQTQRCQDKQTNWTFSLWSLRRVKDGKKKREIKKGILFEVLCSFYETALTCLGHSFRLLPRALQVRNHCSCRSKRTTNCCKTCKVPGKPSHVPGSLLPHKSHSLPMETTLSSHSYPRANELQARADCLR